MSEENKKVDMSANTQLDSPLVVHKKSDASYQETASEIVMNETHTQEDEPTLERHRFKKDSNKGSKGWIILVIIVIIAAVFAGLYYGGIIKFDGSKTTASTTESTTESTTLSLQEQYKGTIVVKGTYIFVDGSEVDGLNGLQKKIKYDDPSPTAYKIIDENANSDFLNYNILPLMQSMGFYGEETVITHIESTGLMAKAEITQQQTSAKATKAKAKAKSKAKTKEKAKTKKAE